MARIADSLGNYPKKLFAALSSWWRRDAACIVYGDQLSNLFARVRRRPLHRMAEHLDAGNRSVALLLDHAHGGAADVLNEVQQRHAEHFDAGAVVIGVENLPSGDDAALEAYRRMARAPVFGVDLRKAADVLLLDEALMATRVAATLRRGVMSETFFVPGHYAAPPKHSIAEPQDFA